MRWKSPLNHIKPPFGRRVFVLFPSASNKQIQGKIMLGSRIGVLHVILFEFTFQGKNGPKMAWQCLAVSNTEYPNTVSTTAPVVFRTGFHPVPNITWYYFVGIRSLTNQHQTKSFRHSGVHHNITPIIFNRHNWATGLDENGHCFPMFNGEDIEEQISKAAKGQDKWMLEGLRSLWQHLDFGCRENVISAGCFKRCLFVVWLVGC